MDEQAEQCIIDALLITNQPRTSTLFYSTPNGKQGEFYKLWNNKSNKYRVVHIETSSLNC